MVHRKGALPGLRILFPFPPDGQKAGYAGYPAIDLKLFNEKLADAAKNGWQVFAHVNGDAAAQALIDGFAQTGLRESAPLPSTVRSLIVASWRR
jgi:predicted amidohydrolase YtcJ